MDETENFTAKDTHSPFPSIAGQSDKLEIPAFIDPVCNPADESLRSDVIVAGLPSRISTSWIFWQSGKFDVQKNCQVQNFFRPEGGGGGVGGGKSDN